MGVGCGLLELVPDAEASNEYMKITAEGVAEIEQKANLQLISELMPVERRIDET